MPASRKVASEDPKDMLVITAQRFMVGPCHYCFSTSFLQSSISQCRLFKCHPLKLTAEPERLFEANSSILSNPPLQSDQNYIRGAQSCRRAAVRLDP